MNRMRRLPAALAVLTLAAGLTACSTETEPANMPDDTPAAEETTTADPTAHNDADTEFAQMMTIHHEGAIEMAELSSLSGPELDRRFLELMIDHHRGAVEMAEEHHASGLNDDALALARTIIDDQVEITEMNGLLQNL